MESTINPAVKSALSSTAVMPKKTADVAKAAEPKKTPVSTGKPIVLPEDIVTLSSHESDTSKKPSIPVTNDEKSALLNPASRQYSFSVYG